MKLIMWDIDSGGRNQIDSIVENIRKENSDIVVLTGFRLNHNKRLIINSLKDIGYEHIIYKYVPNKHQDTVLIASREKFEVENSKGSVNDSFLIIKNDDFYIAGMNFTHNLSQKDLVNIFKSKLNHLVDKKLIVTGNMQTAKNYASKNSLGKKFCKKYIDFKDMNLKNTLETMTNYNPDEYSWVSKSGEEYNVDFILTSNKFDEECCYCYYNHDVKTSRVSSHSMIVFNNY